MGHWYDEFANPRHFEGSGGRPTTLRDARRLEKQGDRIYPSVTTLLGTLAKPALTTWLQETALLTSIDNPPRAAETHIEWARRVIKIAREQTMEKADAGTAIHDALELYFKGIETKAQLGIEFLPMCEAVDAALTAYCGRQAWTPEESFVNERIGYGGKCDLYSQDWVVDFKTKDTNADVAKARGWEEQAMQLAAYRHALLGPESEARMINVFIPREWNDESEVKIFEHTDPLAMDKFRAVTRLWSYQKKYGPYYERKYG